MNQNLGELEEFFSKKYEYIFRIVNSSNPVNYNVTSPKASSTLK
jgi:hypothetical protein